MKFSPKATNSKDVNEFEEIQVLWGLIKIKTVNIGNRGIILILSILAFVIIFTIVKQTYNLKIEDKNQLKIEELSRP
jgi:hypothetical protein